MTGESALVIQAGILAGLLARNTPGCPGWAPGMQRGSGDGGARGQQDRRGDRDRRGEG